MRKLFLIFGVLALGACQTTPASEPSTAATTPVASLPGGAAVCAAIKSDKFDLALKAYGAAVDAINLLIDAKVIVPGTPRALAVANANDKVLSAFSVAESARNACNSTSYFAALSEANNALTEIRAALHK